MSEPPVPVGVGEMLAGKYRVDRVLGAGGMGIVVAATHVQLDQHVAIKFLLPAALASPEVVARFQREARAAVKIQSEHVARVIDVGTLESGAPYMVMEYLEGTDLAHRIVAGPPLATEEVAKFVLQACEALAEAHAAGIVHRDVKPANLFLAKRSDKTSSIKVLDFGISKSPLGGGASGGITSTQAVMGSPYYMSPEQLMSAKHVDHRSDIWSLGIVLYESLAGEPPYKGDTLAEIVAQILQSGPPSVARVRSDVSPEMDVVIARCLAKDPKARYQDVAELARALARLTTDGARSVDRISRVLGESVRPGQVTPTPMTTPASDGRGGTIALSRGNTPMPSPANTAAGWGQTSEGASPPVAQKRTGLWIGIAAGCTALGVLAIVIGMASNRGPAPATGPAGIVAADTATTAPPSLTIPPPPDLATPLAMAASAMAIASAVTLQHPIATQGAAVTVRTSPVTKPQPSARPQVVGSATAAPPPATATATMPKNKLDMQLR